MRMRVRVMFTLLYNKWLRILNCDNNHVCVIVDWNLSKNESNGKNEQLCNKNREYRLRINIEYRI